MKNKNKPFNHLWWIIPLLVVLFAIIFLIFCAFKNNYLDYKDWLAFLGSYLGFAGSVVLGYVAVYQNKRLRDDNEIQHKNAIKPILNVVYRKIHLLNLVDMREYYHHLKFDDTDSVEFTQIIPRDIRSLHKEFLDLSDASSNTSVSDKVYNKLDRHYMQNLDKLSKKYVLIDFYIDNNGNGNAINLELMLNSKKLSITPSLQSNKYNACLLLIEVSEKQNTIELKLDLSYSNIDNEKFNKQEVFLIERNVNGQLILKDK